MHLGVSVTFKVLVCTSNWMPNCVPNYLDWVLKCFIKGHHVVKTHCIAVLPQRLLQTDLVALCVGSMEYSMLAGAVLAFRCKLQCSGFREFGTIWPRWPSAGPPARWQIHPIMVFTLYNSAGPWFPRHQTEPHHTPSGSQFWMTATLNDGHATNYLFRKVKLNGCLYFRQWVDNSYQHGSSVKGLLNWTGYMHYYILLQR